jgi:hypothetical protein
MHLGHFSFELTKSLFASLLAHIVRHRSQSSGIFVWLSLLLVRSITRVTESVARVLDFVVASLVSSYFRLINLLFKACFTVLESEQSRFLLGFATSSANLVLTHNFSMRSATV